MKPMKVIERYLSAPARKMTVADVQGEIRKELEEQGVNVDHATAEFDKFLRENAREREMLVKKSYETPAIIEDVPADPATVEAIFGRPSETP